MAQAQPKEQLKKGKEQLVAQLSASLERLKAQGDVHLNKKYGFNREFLQQVQTEQRGMELCEQAIETLSISYIEQLTQFKEARTPLEALRYLEQAETIWMGETTIIRHFDKDRGEAAFLNGIREQTYLMMQNKLEEAAAACAQNPAKEQVALCLALLGVMDTILTELGRPEGGIERQRLRTLAKAFA